MKTNLISKLFLIAASRLSLLTLLLISNPTSSTEASSHSVLDLPLFAVTIDETDPGKPGIPPLDDQCPLNVPCKVQTLVAIGPDKPLIPIATVTPPAFYVAPGAAVPDGAPVGLASFQVVVALDAIGPCDTSGIPVSGQALLRDASIDPTTTTDSPLDLTSSDNWPSQLNDEVEIVTTHVPSAQLWARYVGLVQVSGGFFSAVVPINILVFKLLDGSSLSVYLIDDPSASVLAADGSLQLSLYGVSLCSPFTAQTTIMGVTAVPEDSQPYPLRVCLAPGEHIFVGVFLPLYDSVLEADPFVLLTDTATCEGTLDDPDGDGIPDPLDQCPDDPEDPDGIQDEDGCPEIDADSDGVDDTDDNCPRVPNPDQSNADGDGHGDACDPDDDNDNFTDEMEQTLGSNPLNPDSTPEHFSLNGFCSDGLDNDLDGLTDGEDPGCHPFQDSDGDGFPDPVELFLGSDPTNPDSTPEHFVLPQTCLDGLDNDLDGLTDGEDEGCFPFLDSDGDGFLNLQEAALGSDPNNPDSTPEQFLLPETCFDGLDNDLDDLTDAQDPTCGPLSDSDGDGFLNEVEVVLGSDPTNPNSTPEHLLFAPTCNDGIDNDLDGQTDFHDAGCFLLDADGDGELNPDDSDDDGDGSTDALEQFLGTDPLDNCGINAWPPDTDDNLTINAADFGLILASWQKGSGDGAYIQRSDLDGNGVANAADFGPILALWQQPCS